MEQKIAEIKKLVRSILTADKKSRCSDKWLYTKLLEMSEIEGLTTEEKQTLIDLLRKARLPKFSTVMRARQHLQAREPELSEELTRERRKELEEKYRKEFSSNGEQQ